MSRKHVWTERNGVVSLYGGKYTTAAWTAREGVTIAANLLGRPIPSNTFLERRDLKNLPGSLSSAESAELRQSLSLHGVSQDRHESLLSRYGKRLGEHYLEYVDGAPDKLVELETKIALDTEQVESVEDLLRRRLELEYTADHGEQFLTSIRSIMMSIHPSITLDQEIEAYRARMKTVQSLLGKA
jgi:glycerol-3-phosphate dehydrogenase